MSPLAAAGALLLAACSGEGGSAPAAAGESWLVVDADAPQDGVPGFPGVVWRFDRARGTVARFAADPRFVDPQRILRTGSGELLLLDFSAAPSASPAARAGAVFVLDEASGAVLRALELAAFAAPTGMALAPDGTLYVTDRRAAAGREAGAGGQGALFAVDLAAGTARTVAADPRFRAPADLLLEPDGSVLMLDADAVGKFPDSEGVLFRIDPASGATSVAGELEHTISPLSLLAEPGGDLLVIDANADPRRVGGPLGAVFRWRRASGATELVASILAFRDPARAAYDGAGGVVLIDANADPAKRGPDAVGRGQNATGPGALFTLDPATGAVALLATPEGLVNPVALLCEERPR